MTDNAKAILHGSAVALDGGAVMMQGLSGSGKSDLCFRLIESGGKLICDDQVALERRQGKIMVSAVAAIRGLIEIRGVGLVKYPVAVPTRLFLVVRLVKREEVPRLPEWETADILGVALPQLKLHAFDASTPLKIRKAIELAQKPDLLIK
jgi:serine kinase of HPr protein (carbohydrate metabolism regulator)